MSLVASHQHAIAHETSGIGSSGHIFQWHAFHIRTRFKDLYKRNGVWSVAHNNIVHWAANAETLCSLLFYVAILIMHERHQQNSKKHTKAAVYSKSLFITTNASSKDSVPTIHQKHSEQRHRQSVRMVASVKEKLERASKQHLSLVRKVVTMLLTDKHHVIALTANQHRVREKNHDMFPAAAFIINRQSLEL